MRVALALCTLALVVGCASGLRIQARGPIERGEYATAAALLEKAIQNGDMGAWNDLGVVHERMGNRDKAIQLYTMGARWGDQTAQRNLINLGAPVPPADLAAANAQQRAANAANTAATLQLMRALNPPPAPVTPINCTSQRIGTTVQTNCF